MIILTALIVLTSSEDIYGGATAKYVPPHQRQSQSGQKQAIERLRKQVKGLLNRYVFNLASHLVLKI